MDSSSVQKVLFLVMAGFIALYLGSTAATAKLESIAWVGGGGVLSICLLLGRRIWLLLPLMSALSLVLPLPGNFPLAFLTQLLVAGFCTLLFLMRKLPSEIRFTELEFWCVLLMLCLIQVYARNPVGLSILGTNSVGGKDYAMILVGFSAAAFVSILRVDPRDLIWYVRLTIIGSLGNFLLGAFTKLFPSMGYFLGASFSAEVREESGIEGQASRVSFVRGISVTMARWVSSRISPLQGCFHPVYAPLILLSFGFAALSGFRSQIMIVGLFYLVGTAYRGGFKSVVVSSVLGGLLLVLLAFVNVLSPLPPNIQRSLTFLPGTWEERYKSDAQGSTEWRVEMWKEALLTDRWIQNKWLGDGLGMTKAELAASISLYQTNRAETSGGGLSAGQVNMMLAGGYHSGPVQTVRLVGYVGLAVLFIGFIRMMVHAHRQIRRARDTEWYYHTLFICLPIVVNPIAWTLLYGTFRGGALGLFMGCAMIRLLERNLPLPAYVPAQRRGPTPAYQR